MPAPLAVAGAAWQHRRSLGWLAAGAVAVPLLGFGVMFAALGGGLSSSASGAAPSDLALDTIPPRMLKLYQAAASKYGLEWEYLAAIGKVESNHGRLDGGCETSSAGARGPMQFMPGTWAAYGNGGNVCDPGDAVPAAARYLKASGAPDNWDKALFAYNHAGWYVALVKEWAEKYRGPLLTLPGLPSNDGHSQALQGRWLARVPGTNAVCDKRIVRDVVMILRRYRMAAGDCYAMTGHAIDGEHPLGLGLDLVPAANGSWDLLDRAARDFGWRVGCARTGCRDRLPSPFAFIGWNYYPGHGTPQHAGKSAHLHLSWQHTPASPGSPAGRVKTLLAP